MINETAQPALLTAAEVGEMLRISTRTVWRLKSRGKLPKHVQVGGLVFWNREAIIALINGKPPKKG